MRGIYFFFHYFDVANFSFTGFTYPRSFKNDQFAHPLDFFLFRSKTPILTYSDNVILHFESSTKKPSSIQY